jgi:hypothetical protein
MSGQGKRSDAAMADATAPFLDSTEELAGADQAVEIV